MLDELFNFPIVMIDGENEERKQEGKLGIPGEEDEDYDMIFGEAEYPYWDFIGIEDRWLPSQESLQKALDGKFEACIVRFLNVGQMLVPWSRKKFKSELKKFAAVYEAANPEEPTKPKQLRILTLTPEQFKKETETENGKEG